MHVSKVKEGAGNIAGCYYKVSRVPGKLSATYQSHSFIVHRLLFRRNAAIP